MKSLRILFTTITLALIFIIYSISGAVMLLNFSNTTKAEIKSGLKTDVDKNALFVDREFRGIQKLSEGYAITIQNLIKTQGKTDKETTINNLLDIMKDYIKMNPQIIGGGFWFEPNQFESNKKYVGPYVYKDKNEIKTTMEYSTDEYNYFQYDWYKNGMNTTKSSVMSEPYLDSVTGISMITVTSPISLNGKKVGVVTIDIGITELSNYIKSIKVGESGSAYLVTGEGSYLAHKDESKNLKLKINEEKDASLKTLGESIIKTKGTQITTVNDKLVAFTVIGDTGIKLVEEQLSSETYKNIYKMVPINIAIMLIFLAIIGLSLFNSISIFITKPISKLTKMAKSIADGDLTKMVDIKSRTEIGRLSDELKNMQRNLSTLANNVQSEASKVEGVVQAINKQTEDLDKEMKFIANITETLSAGMEETAASTQEINGTATEIDNAITSIAKKAEEGATVSSGISTKASNLNVEFKNAQKKSIQTFESNKKVLEVALENAKNVEKINDLSSAILQITKQTNLLSLNASIEAARAGEAGKGFAVVANEIRKLAESSRDTATQIQDVTKIVIQSVDDLKTSSVNLLSFMEIDVNSDYEKMLKTTNEYEKDAFYINDLVTDFSATAEELSASVENLTSIISEIATATSESASSTLDIASKIGEAMTNLTVVSQKTSEAKESSKTLMKTTSSFKTK